MISHAVESKAIKGVEFAQDQMVLSHLFYADNTTMMFEAEEDSALKCKEIFEQFGAASGLKVNWAEMAAVLIAADSPSRIAAVPLEMGNSRELLKTVRFLLWGRYFP
jgi:hypothetical protein